MKSPKSEVRSPSSLNRRIGEPANGRSDDDPFAVSWPAPAEGWLLHATTNLATVPIYWTEIPPPYPTNGANLQFIEPVPTSNKFYRLHKP